jgi:hypothetical protein
MTGPSRAVPVAEGAAMGPRYHLCRIETAIATAKKTMEITFNALVARPPDSKRAMFSVAATRLA